MNHGRVMMFVGALWVSACSDQTFQTEHDGVEDGNASLAAGKVGEAQRKYEQAALELPASPELDYVSGLALSEADEHHRATQTLIRALATKDDALLQRVRAALGLAYGRWALVKEAQEKKENAAESSAQPPTQPATPSADPPPEDDNAPPKWTALELWEKSADQLERALVMNPDDAESLRNLEVALLRIDPPCSARDDTYEPNNTPDKAAPIEAKSEEAPMQSGAPKPAPGEGKDELSWKGDALMSCPDDVDYYAISLEQGDRLTVELSAEKEAGRIGLALLSPDGKRRLRPAEGLDEPLTKLEFFAGGNPGRYLIRVDNLDGDEVPYVLTAKVRPPCRKTEDDMEENDTPETAKRLTHGSIEGLKLCPMDPDWYRITLADGESLMVTAALTGANEQQDTTGTGDSQPGFSLKVAAVDGSVEATGAAFNQTRVVALFTPGAGDYTIAVEGLPQLEQRYTLTVQIVPPCDQGGDDKFEDNDIVEDATDLEAEIQAIAKAAAGASPGGGAPQQAPTLPLRLCPDDADWFKITARPEERKNVTAIFEHAKGDLSLQLFDADGTTEVAVANASSNLRNGESLALPEVEEDTVYMLKIAAPEGVENFYHLRLDQPDNNNQQDEKNDASQDQDDKPQDQDDKPQDQDDKPQDKDDKPQDKDDSQEREKQKQQQRRPMDDKIDKLDHNPKNLEAQKARRTSPLANHPPEKDW